jgi:GT2 family glycosyltransferase
MKKLCVLFLTYNRMVYADPCLRSILRNIKWSGELHVHIADDGSPGNYVDSLRTIVGSNSAVHSVGVSNSERRGYGANYNLATQHIHNWCDLVLVVEDDWKLMHKLDLDKLAVALEDARIGCIRLGYLGITQQLYGEFVYIDSMSFWLLDHNSSEPHVFAGHPRLETVGWQRYAGTWPEGEDPNRTEFLVAERVRKGVAWPAWANPDGSTWFAHIGTERAR